MKKVLILLSILTINQIAAQTGELIIINFDTQKERIIPENKRVQIVTDQDFKIRGRFVIVDESTIMIKEQYFKLSEILLIRRSPQFDAIMTIVNIVWIGGWSLVAGAFGVIPIYFALAITASTTYAIFDPPNWNKPYSKISNWIYSIKMGANNYGIRE